jgi:hypothetical protein
MIGKNVLRLNHATVMEALEEYINRRALPAGRVVVKKVQFNAQIDQFDVDVEPRPIVDCEDE